MGKKVVKTLIEKKGKQHPRDSFTPQLAADIIKLVRTGENKTNVCKLVKIGYATLNRWLTIQSDPRYVQFQEEFDHAEAEAARRMSLKIQQAATGYERVVTQTTTSQVVKMKETKFPDGRVVKEPVTLTLETVQTTKSNEFDWRAAMEFLARRWPGEWSSRQKIEHSGEIGTPPVDLSNLTDEEIAKLEHLMERAAQSGTGESRKVSAELN